ncbi:class A sortase [Lysinibacillus sp. 54212]|uniref:class A sortase n=1 Tax=Lysinibacillus sp. 54212 TaxID=3119829 RepID=UPI002FCC1496
MKNTRSKLVSVLLVLMLLVGVMLLLLQPIQNYLVKRLSSNTIPVSSEQIVQNAASDVSFDFEEVQSLTLSDILKAQASRKDLPVIGSIAVPSVDLELPIIKGVGKQALAAGAGTMKPEQSMGVGNYALASHYVEGEDILFGPLYEANVGDAIYLSDMEFIYEYELTTKEVIEATEVTVIDDIKDETVLTLITCAEEGTKRLAVRAQFKEKRPLESESP